MTTKITAVDISTCLLDAVRMGRITPELHIQARSLFEKTLAQDRKDNPGNYIAAARLVREAFVEKQVMTRAKDNWMLKAVEDFEQAQVDEDLIARVTTNPKGHVAGLKALIMDQVGGKQGHLVSEAARAEGELRANLQRVQKQLHPGVYGQQRSPDEAIKMVRELFDENTDNPIAKELARTFKETSKLARKMMNEAKGNVRDNPHWHLPQPMNRLAVKAMSRNDFIAFTKDLVDPTKMFDKSGNPLGHGDLVEFLGSIHDDILEEFLVMSVATRSVSEPRALVLKDADSWLKLQAKLGHGDNIYSIIDQHVVRWSKEIAFREMFGPRYVQGYQKLRTLFLNRTLGGGENLDKVKAAVRYTDNLLDVFWGLSNMPVNETFGNIMRNVRFVDMAALLGRAFFASWTDVHLVGFTAKRVGMGGRMVGGKVIGQFIASILGKNKKDIIALQNASGILTHYYHATSASGARFTGISDMSGALGRTASTVINVSALNRWTHIGRAVFAVEFQRYLYTISREGLEGTDLFLKNTLKKYGITPEEIKQLGKIPAFEGRRDFNMLTVTDIHKESPEIAEKIVRMINTELDRAVPTSSVAATASLVGNTRPGTILGEFTRSWALFHQFAMNLYLVHWRMVAEQGTLWRGLTYGGQLFMGLTLWGALITTVKDIAMGRDPPSLKDPKFWVRAILQGGGLGIYGDIGSTIMRGRGTADYIAGAPFGTLMDATRLVATGVDAAITGETDKLARATRRALVYIPGSNLWYQGLFHRRFILDQVEMLIDPDADRRMRRLARRARKKGRPYWWAPGETRPKRLPDFSNLTRTIN